ncbi:lytic transglycosylase domain-containing protein [Propionibacteriaceae bacterium Y2011]|uniref:aggregation-promoting factor C-terminal-like domain-containing protein n=1 Tax=Microlunatus sp. Y2014 TaxID=3418488 RepID=UPI003B447B44
MRDVTRHALTGALLAAAALGVAVSVDHPHTAVFAEPAVHSAVPAAGGEPTGREERSNRSEPRSSEAAASASAAAQASAEAEASQRAAAARSKAAAAREKALAEQRDRREQAAEQLLQRQIREDGYDPRTATTPREIGRQMAANKYGWTGQQWVCYDKLIVSESNWKTTATNPSSGAYGIPQSLPASKMASAGSDWKTNPATQLKWGLKYVKDRFGTPCSAWSFKQANNWY